MLKKLFYILVLLVGTFGSSCFGIEAEQADMFVGQDLHLRGGGVTSHRLSTGEHVLVFADGLSVSIGAHQFSSVSGVVWLESLSADYVGREGTGYRAIVYVRGGITRTKAVGARTTDLHEKPLEGGEALLMWFVVSGEILVTADNRASGDPAGSELYRKAIAGLRSAGIGEVIVKSADSGAAKPEPGRVEPGKTVGEVTERPSGEPKFRYPILWAPAGEAPVQLRGTKDPNERGVATVMGRFYMSQKQDEKGGLLELQADNAVIFYSTKQLKPDQEQPSPEDALAAGALQGIYLSGDVLMTSGQRTIRAEELYYDFERSKAIIKKAVMRNFDETRGIPIYVRAEELRQEAKDKFTAENATLTTDEFARPQIVFRAEKMSITDTTSADAQTGGVTKKSYEAEMHNVRFDVYGRTLLHLPHVKSDLERPDIPIKSAHIGKSNLWGWMAETRWYLARILGIDEPEGTESTLAADYYGKRGVGAGVEVDYVRENYFGRVLGYVIHDSGEDRLGRHDTRRNLEPSRELRGRFRWQHRQFLPYNWQLTSEVSYSSDLNFIESFYRSEFNVGKEQETLVHLKRIEDNWGLSFLAKMRINDFVSKLEELPTGEFHWLGQSFFNDRLTFYSDSQISRLRQRYASSTTLPGPQQFFTYATTRNEVDMPLSFGKTKVVPFVAGTVAYEDRFGYFRELDGGAGPQEDNVWYGETGVRVSREPYWKVFPNAKSRLLDIDQLRHLVRPHLTAVGYHQSDSVIEQRDVLNVGLSQRLQTKRGTGQRRRTVDWMRLNTDFTWVNDPAGASAGADRFIWSKPFIPMINTDSAAVPQLDRRSSNMFGLRRHTFGADYSWRLSDTTALLSDMNYDMQSGVVQQYNIGFSHMRWPDLNYYIGSRYLRRITILDPTTGGVLQRGSNAVIFAITYVLDPRYTVIFSQQVDFDYGATVSSDITILRRYHRMYWGLSFKADESLDEQSVVFSIWPQGVPDLAVGPRRYMRVARPERY